MFDCLLRVSIQPQPSTSAMGSSQSRSSLNNNNKSSAVDPAGTANHNTVNNNIHNHHNHKVLKFPAPISEDLANSVQPITVDPHTYRHLVQDVTVVKTLLFRLKRVLQEADTVNPFESALSTKQNGYLKQSLDELINSGDANLAVAEFTKEDFREENSALRTQVALMRQQIEEKDSIISEQKAKIEELERLCKHAIPGKLAISHHHLSETAERLLPDLLTARSES